MAITKVLLESQVTAKKRFFIVWKTHLVLM